MIVKTFFMFFCSVSHPNALTLISKEALPTSACSFSFHLKTPSPSLRLHVCRYLSDLHAPGDPAWQCIYAQHKWILQLMQNCRDEFTSGQRGD